MRNRSAPRAAERKRSFARSSTNGWKREGRKPAEISTLSDEGSRGRASQEDGDGGDRGRGLDCVALGALGGSDQPLDRDFGATARDLTKSSWWKTPHSFAREPRERLPHPLLDLETGAPHAVAAEGPRAGSQGRAAQGPRPARGRRAQAALPDRGLAGFFLADRDARLADARLIFGAGRSSSTSS